MTDEPQTGPPVWRTAHLRLTAFPQSYHQTSLAREWWSALTRVSPEGVIDLPPAGSVKVLGVFNGAPLSIEVKPERVDIERPFSVGQPRPSALPPFDGDVLPRFSGLVADWLGLASRPPIRRLAFGATVMKTYPEMEDCREALDGYLPPLDMQATEPEGFMYQVDRKCESQGLAVNRIVKWSVLQYELVGGGSTPGIQLEMDMNSDARYSGALERPAELFGEFVQHARRFAEEGDRP